MRMVFALAATILLAQQPAVQPGEVLVRVETAFGNIDLAIDTKRAPITASNFLKYVDGGFYDGGRFHRATRTDNYKPNLPNRPLLEIIQADINPARAAERLPAIPLERTNVTGLTHVVGTVSMPRGQSPDSARSGFVIHFNDQPSLNHGGMRFDDGQGTAAFGRVVAGLDVAKKIQMQPVKEQALEPPVAISRIRRVGSRARSDVLRSCCVPRAAAPIRRDSPEPPPHADAHFQAVGVIGSGNVPDRPSNVNESDRLERREHAGVEPDEEVAS
jgi:peptidyl-prolyl cis-trans isomerase A (cyclophilin A)